MGSVLYEPKFSFLLKSLHLSIPISYLGMELLIHLSLSIISHVISYPGTSDYLYVTLLLFWITTEAVLFLTSLSGSFTTFRKILELEKRS